MCVFAVGSLFKWVNLILKANFLPSLSLPFLSLVSTIGTNFTNFYFILSIYKQINLFLVSFKRYSLGVCRVAFFFFLSCEWDQWSSHFMVLYHKVFWWIMILRTSIKIYLVYLPVLVIRNTVFSCVQFHTDFDLDPLIGNIKYKWSFRWLDILFWY